MKNLFSFLFLCVAVAALAAPTPTPISISEIPFQVSLELARLVPEGYEPEIVLKVGNNWGVVWRLGWCSQLDDCSKRIDHPRIELVFELRFVPIVGAAREETITSFLGRFGESTSPFMLFLESNFELPGCNYSTWKKKGEELEAARIEEKKLLREAAKSYLRERFPEAVFYEK